MGLKEYRERVQAEKRATLLIAAREAFLEQGYGRVTVASIAKRAGTSLATLYKHYDGKASLFIAVIENLSAGLVAELSAIDLSGLAPAAALLQLGRLYGRLLQRPDVAALVRLVIAESPHHPALSQMLYDHGKGPMASPLRGYLIEQCDAGVLDVPDLDLATRHFMAMIEGSVLWRSLLQGDMATAAHLDAVVQSATATFLARFRVPCPP